VGVREAVHDVVPEESLYLMEQARRPGCQAGRDTRQTYSRSSGSPGKCGP